MHNPPPVSDEWKRTPGKKNTFRWCRGKEGREHEYDIRVAYWYGRFSKCGYVRDLYPWWETASFWKGKGDNWNCGHEKYCTVCGKVLGSIKNEDCPERPENKVN